VNSVHLQCCCLSLFITLFFGSGCVWINGDFFSFWKINLWKWMCRKFGMKVDIGGFLRDLGIKSSEFNLKNYFKIKLEIFEVSFKKIWNFNSHSWKLLRKPLKNTHHPHLKKALIDTHSIFASVVPYLCINHSFYFSFWLD